MARTLGYHIVISGYGLWLPGDERGSWSAAWDEQIGFVEPHTLHPADPVRLRMSQERMRQAPVRLDDRMIQAGKLALDDVEVRPTDAAAPDFDSYLIGSGLRVRHFDPSQRSGVDGTTFFENHRFH